MPSNLNERDLEIFYTNEKLSESKILSQLFLCFLGEPCVFTALKVSGMEYRINEDIMHCLPLALSSAMDKIVTLSSFILYIKHWRKRIESNDVIKKAIIETILDEYNVYMELADNLRMEHMGSNDQYELNDMVDFALMWYKRIRYMRSIISIVDTANNNGMTIMNLLVREWILSCIRDWEYGFLGHLLTRSSESLIKILNKWILDGQIVHNTYWMIRTGIPKLASIQQRQLLNSPNTSLNSSSTSILEPSFDKKSRGDFLSPVSEMTTVKQAGTTTHITAKELNIQVAIDKECIPFVLKDSPDLVELIRDIGQKVHFLKTLRNSPTYEHKLAERQKLLEPGTAISNDIWYNTARLSRFSIAINEIKDIVYDDVMCELMERQRLIDHFSLIHGYFFMLRGDLCAELERTILINFLKSAVCHHTPMSLRKGGLKSAKMAEHIVNEALCKCSPPENLVDLMQFLFADRASKDRRKSFYELFGITYDPQRKRYGNEMATTPMNEFFPRDLLRVYRRVFSALTNFQMLRFQLDELTHQFNINTGSKLRRQKEHQFVFSVEMNLHRIRAFINCFLNYFIENVLVSESSKILNALKKDIDPQGFINRHRNLMKGIISAFFINPGAEEMHNAISSCIEKARKFVEAVEDFCNEADKEKGSNESDENENQPVVHLPDSVNVDRRRKDSVDPLQAQRFLLEDRSTQFEKSISQLQVALSQFIANKGRIERDKNGPGSSLSPDIAEALTFLNEALLALNLKH